MLTPKQKRFCEEYTVDFNGTQAAIRAGYSKKTANVISAENLAKPNIQNYIAELTKKQEEKTEITKDRLIQELAKLAFFDIRKIYTVDGGLKNIHDFGDDEAAAVAGIESFDEKEPDSGMVLGTTQKVKFLNRINAIERISKMLGYESAIKQELSGSVDFGTFLTKAMIKK